MKVPIGQQIALAFSHRQRSTSITDLLLCPPLREDPLHFATVKWVSVTADDWTNYDDAFSGVSPDVFTRKAVADILPGVQLTLHHEELLDLRI